MVVSLCKIIFIFELFFFFTQASVLILNFFGENVFRKILLLNKFCCNLLGYLFRVGKHQTQTDYMTYVQRRIKTIEKEESFKFK